MSVKVIEISGKEIPGDVFGVAYKFGERLSRPAGYMEYGGATITARKTGDSVIVIVVVTAGNFVSVPRIFRANDGYGGNLVATGNGNTAYPLSIDGATTQTLSLPEDEDPEVSRDGAVYGNIDWMSADGVVLTWKGPTGRTLPCDVNKPISGLTTDDITFGELALPKYTCFGTYIYQDGAVTYTAPGAESVIVDGVETQSIIDISTKVLGAAHTEYAETVDGATTTKTALVCIVNNHYAGIVGFFEEVWINKGDVAMYDADDHPNGWLMLATRQAGRPTSCWLFNQSGTRATQGVMEYTIDLATNTATLDVGSNTHIECLMTLGGNSQITTYSGSTKVWSDYKGDQRVFATVSATGGHDFSISQTYESKANNVIIYQMGTPNKTISVGLAAGGGGIAVQVAVTGIGCACDVTLSISGGGSIVNGIIVDGAGCGTGVVTATCGGLTATVEYRYPSGQWETVSDWTSARYDAQPGDYPYSDVSGDGGVRTSLFISNASVGTPISYADFCAYSIYGCFLSQYVPSQTINCSARDGEAVYSGGLTFNEGVNNYTRCAEGGCSGGSQTPGASFTTTVYQANDCQHTGRILVQRWVC